MSKDVDHSYVDRAIAERRGVGALQKILTFDDAQKYFPGEPDFFPDRLRVRLGTMFDNVGFAGVSDPDTGQKILNNDCTGPMVVFHVTPRI